MYLFVIKLLDFIDPYLSVAHFLPLKTADYEKVMKLLIKIILYKQLFRIRILSY